MVDLWLQVIRFSISGSDPGFAEAFESYFGRPYDEQEAEMVYSQVGSGLHCLDNQCGTRKNIEKTRKETRKLHFGTMTYYYTLFFASII